MFSISHALILWTQINKEKIVWCNVLVHYNIHETTNATDTVKSTMTATWLQEHLICKYTTPYDDNKKGSHYLPNVI